MLVFSYGIPKSGSTLAFQLARCIAALNGHSQRLMPPPLSAPGHRVNFHQELDPALLRAVADRAGDRVLVVKTHARPGPEWIAEFRRLAALGRVAAHVNHRDPRDICLALLDAGEKARRAGEAAFSEFVTLDDAARRTAGYLEELRLWAALPGVLELRYEVCAFRMDEAIGRIKAHLGLRCPNWPVRLYVNHLAFTHRNKAVPERHRRELDPAARARLDEVFGPYLEAAGYARD
jgi:hypothetical protein